MDSTDNVSYNEEVVIEEGNNGMGSGFRTPSTTTTPSTSGSCARMIF